MSKLTGRAGNAPLSGHFVPRGAKIGRFTAMGTAEDGTVIIAPKQKPASFTKRELRDAVRTVKDARQRAS